MSTGKEQRSITNIQDDLTNTRKSIEFCLTAMLERLHSENWEFAEGSYCTYEPILKNLEMLEDELGEYYQAHKQEPTKAAATDTPPEPTTIQTLLKSPGNDLISVLLKKLSERGAISRPLFFVSLSLLWQAIHLNDTRNF